MSHVLASVSSWLSSASHYVVPVVSVSALLAICVVGAGLTLMGLPGNWLILLAAFGYDFLILDGSRIEMGHRILIVLLILAVAGEALELLTGTMGVARRGGSKRGAAGALVGSIAGGIFGAGLGVPIPIIGPVLGLIAMAAVGALIGATVAERSTGRELAQSLDIGMAAMWGRVAGSIAKSVVSLLMIFVVIVGLLLVS